MFNSYIMKEKGELITVLANDFNTCLNPTKRTDYPFKTVRAHFVDTRTTEVDKIISPSHLIGFLMEDLEEYDFILLEKIKIYGQILNEISKLNSYSSLATFVLKNAMKIPNIKKEIDKCYLNKKLFLSIFHNVLVELYEKEFDINILKNIDTPTLLETVYDLLLILESPLVDIYSIARMFKIFKKDTIFPRKPKYIYYAGDGHSNTVRKFLEKLNFKQHMYIESNTKTSTRCLDRRMKFRFQIIFFFINIKCS